LASSKSGWERDAVTALEAERQRERLNKNQISHAFRPSDVCAGGNRLDDCETAQPMIAEAEAYATRIAAEGPGVDDKGRFWNTLAWLGKTCATCELRCDVAIETRGGKPTDIIRFSNTKPLTDVAMRLASIVYPSAD